MGYDWEVWGSFRIGFCATQKIFVFYSGILPSTLREFSVVFLVFGIQWSCKTLGCYPITATCQGIGYVLFNAAACFQTSRTLKGPRDLLAYQVYQSWPMATAQADATRPSTSM